VKYSRFIPRVVSALLGAIGRCKVTLSIDNVHVLDGSPSFDILIRMIEVFPERITLVMARWHELSSSPYPLKMDRLATLKSPRLIYASTTRKQKSFGAFLMKQYIPPLRAGPWPFKPAGLHGGNRAQLLSSS